MVVGIFEIFLDQVVIDVLGGQLGLDPGQAEAFELEHDEGAGGVLGKRLVDLERDLLAWVHPAVDEMGVDEFLGDVLWHR